MFLNNPSIGGSGGGVSLSDNNIWTGENTFRSDFNLGSSTGGTSVTPTWTISLTYLTISAVDYDDGFYFTPGPAGDFQEILAADQVLVGGALGVYDFDFIVFNVTGGVHDGENITALFDIDLFTTDLMLENYIISKLGATSISTTIFRVGNVSSNGATSSYTWALPIGATYTAGSDPSDSGYITYYDGIVGIEGQLVHYSDDLGTKGFEWNTDGDQYTFNERVIATDLLVAAGGLVIKEGDTPSSPFAGYGYFVTKTDNKLYFVDGGGTEHEITYST